MDEVRESILKASDGVKENFTEVAVKWASYCLRNLKGDLLAKGLDIAKALSKFDTTMMELNHKEED